MKINLGDIVYLNNDDSTKYIVLGRKEIGSSVFVHLCDLENNDYCGWFNINKIKRIQSYYPDLYEKSVPIKPCQYTLNHGISLSAEDAKYLNDPVIYRMAEEVNRNMVKDLDRKIKEDLYNE